VFGTIAFVLMTTHWVRLTGGRPEGLSLIRPAGSDDHLRLDINRATWVEWMQLEEIGETLARRIVEDREHRGPFLSIDDLARVKGLGPATIARVRDSLECRPGDPEAPSAAARERIAEQDRPPPSP
jgi:competence protein ComEA